MLSYGVKILTAIENKFKKAEWLKEGIERSLPVFIHDIPMPLSVIILAASIIEKPDQHEKLWKMVEFGAQRIKEVATTVKESLKAGEYLKSISLELIKGDRGY